jgi:hypothetical protein
MWQCAEDEIYFVERRFVGTDKRDVLSPDVCGLPALSVCCRERERHVWMALDQKAQLTPGVPAGAQNPDRNFMHKECITLQAGCVNQLLSRARSGFCLLRLARQGLEPPHDAVARHL